MELFLEILTEELPTSEVVGFEDAGRGYFKELFDKNDIEADSVEFYFTPRRIVLSADLEPFRKKTSKLIRGPRSPLMASGEFSKAAMGFAKGLKVAPETLIEKDGSIWAEKTTGGEPVEPFIEEIVSSFITGFPFKKRMRWIDENITFARPIHQIVCLYGKKKLNLEISKIPVSLSTSGHRFLAPDPFEVTGFAQYKRKLKEAMVILSDQERRRMIREAAGQLAEQFGGDLLIDEALVQENAALVEYPFAVGGNFHRLFLKLPKEVLITSMKNHQRFFAVIDSDGELMPYFIAISNTPQSHIIREGFEKVLTARFTDALFFFDEDRKIPFEKFGDKLSKIVYHEALGSVSERVNRIEKIALFISEISSIGKAEYVSRAARLCKNDLVTEMVGEFPELQGIMGRIYAGSENEEVARAIQEQYLPSGINSPLPETETGIVLALAEKFELLSSIGSVEMPTGNADPYGLRRAAIGIIRILLDKKIDLNLDKIFDFAYNILEIKKKNSVEKIKWFFNERFRVIAIDRGMRYDIFDAVNYQSTGEAKALNCLDSYRRAKAIEEFLKTGKDKTLLFKRIAHIVPDDFKPTEIELKRLTKPEKLVYESYQMVKDKFDAYFAKKAYLECITALAGLSKAIDNFFDSVMVMDKDPVLKNNRLTILYKLKQLQDKIADFNLINI